MKKDTFYVLRRQSPWVMASGVLMGIPFLVQAVYYLLVRSIVEVHMVELAIFMIAPMAVELLWCLMLHVFPFKTTAALGITSCLVFAMILTYGLFYNNILRTVLCAVTCLAAVQLIVLIFCGRFPYRLFGSVALLLILGCRVMFYTYPAYIRQGNWEMLLTRELPGVCMLASVLCAMGAMEAHKKEVQPVEEQADET